MKGTSKSRRVYVRWSANSVLTGGIYVFESSRRVHMEVANAEYGIGEAVNKDPDWEGVTHARRYSDFRLTKNVSNWEGK